MAHKDRHWGKKVAIALGFGLGAVLVATVVAPKIAQLQAYPWLVPALFAGGGALLIMRGRASSGIGLVGAAGAVAGVQYGPTILSKVNMAPQAQMQQGQPQTAGMGWTQAGAMNSGWYERPAFAAAGIQGGFAHQTIDAGRMSWQDAGAFGGRMATAALETQGIGDDDDEYD